MVDKKKGKTIGKPAGPPQPVSGSAARDQMNNFSNSAPGNKSKKNTGGAGADVTPAKKAEGAGVAAAANASGDGPKGNLKPFPKKKGDKGKK